MFISIWNRPKVVYINSGSLTKENPVCCLIASFPFLVTQFYFIKINNIGNFQNLKIKTLCKYQTFSLTINAKICQ